MLRAQPRWMRARDDEHEQSAGRRAICGARSMLGRRDWYRRRAETITDAWAMAAENTGARDDARRRRANAWPMAAENTGSE